MDFSSPPPPKNLQNNKLNNIIALFICRGSILGMKCKFLRFFYRRAKNFVCFVCNYNYSPMKLKNFPPQDPESMQPWLG